MLRNWSWREVWEYVTATTLETPRSVQKEEEEVLQTQEQRLPCSPWSRPWWGRMCSCNPWRSTVEQVDAQRKLWLCGEFAVERAPGRTCGPTERRSHVGSGFLAGLVTPQGTYAGAVCSWRTAPHERNPQSMGRTYTGAVHGGLSPVGGTPQRSSGRVWGRRSSRDNVWQTDCNSHSLSPCATHGEEGEKLGVKLSPWKREEWGESIF